MNSLRKAIEAVAVFSITTVLSGSALLVHAQTLQPSSIQLNLANLLKQGQVKAKQGDHRGAIAAYTQALRADSKSTEAYLGRGSAHHDLGDFKRAVSDFEQALQLEPRNPKGYC